MSLATDKDREYMRLALEQARTASVQGEVPIGAVLVRDGRVLAQAHNFREIWQDPTAHAEIVAIREAATQSGSWRLTDTTLYVTLEPCAMCIGAIILARIPRLVFGAMDPKAGACGSIFDLPAERKLNHRVEVIGRVLEQESQALLQTFFRNLRNDVTEQAGRFGSEK
ncbi:MAG: nucleoside deaminase [Nitrospiraceae bacterium]|nr:nucleoside deaminase [Nitrospiraceae bacterium]